jgi:hypothetical protein
MEGIFKTTQPTTIKLAGASKSIGHFDVSFKDFSEEGLFTSVTR